MYILISCQLKQPHLSESGPFRPDCQVGLEARRSRANLNKRLGSYSPFPTKWDKYSENQIFVLQICICLPKFCSCKSDINLRQSSMRMYRNNCCIHQHCKLLYTSPHLDTLQSNPVQPLIAPRCYIRL